VPRLGVWVHTCRTGYIKGSQGSLRKSLVVHSHSILVRLVLPLLL